VCTRKVQNAAVMFWSASPSGFKFLSKCLMAGEIPRSSSHATGRNVHISTSALRRFLAFHSPPTTFRSIPKLKKTLVMSVRQSRRVQVLCSLLSLSSKSKAITEKHHGRHDLASWKQSTRIQRTSVRPDGPKDRGVSTGHMMPPLDINTFFP